LIYRYSSRRQKLDKAFLDEKLRDALAYDRIAGYFSSSILEIAGESIESVRGPVRVVCNSELSIEDVKTAKSAMDAQRREWCEYEPEKKFVGAESRLKKLYELLKSGKLQVKVIPNDVFGLIHGKAGVITLKDGSKTAFVGSVNETAAGWKLNYEILWEDDSEEAVQWVQEEFDYFWNSPYAIPLAEFVINDIGRLSERKVISSVEEWRKDPKPETTVVESPIYRKETGLWEHQKYFISLAFEDHKKPYGARYVLADMVGLGKTVQLAMSAQLMALYGDKPILVIVPKTLLWQWQDEMYTLLDMPSAVWTGKEWVDENGIKYPSIGDESIKKCPRRIGIVSQGLITANSPIVDYLLSLEYECVIVDEAHRARRKRYNQFDERLDEDNQNNLMKFLMELSKRTKSMLLATATPVQIHPIEAWDLLQILSQRNDSVLGSKYSKWRTQPERAINLLLGREKIKNFDEIIDWMRDPFPPENEDIVFSIIRKSFNMKEDEFVLNYEAIDKMKTCQEYRSNYRRLERIAESFIENHNPFIRHIVRRTRDFLENTINPETNEPYLKKVEVRLFGESEDEAIILPPYLKKAYSYAEEFCALLQSRVKSAGFFKTLLLKRVGSTIIAGKNTAEKMLAKWDTFEVEDEYEDENTDMIIEERKEIQNLAPQERRCLENFIECLENNKESDPKYDLVLKLLTEDNWLDRGCIIFSQYYDSAYFVAENLSKDLKGVKIGLYAGGDKSGIFIDGIFEKKSREEIKRMIRHHELKILVGTDAASEGLNLQTLGSLINLDLPWNPTRLEQRKGRIQRIGQIFDEVYIYNMRYKDSVEDRVHHLLSSRLENIYNLFGQIPDVLEDVWVKVALNQIEEAKYIIDAVPKQHPFELRYNQIKPINWESCATVLDNTEKKKFLMNGWK